MDIAWSSSILLKYAGYQVETAFEGLSALKLARAFRPDIAILDIGLPGMDGYRLARALREENGPDIVLIALTSYGEEEDRRRSRNAGFDHHLVKPFDFEAIKVLCSRLHTGSRRGSGDEYDAASVRSGCNDPLQGSSPGMPSVVAVEPDSAQPLVMDPHDRGIGA
jgi:DNA-binding response OmpR family regulator